jgi:transposase
MMLLIGRFHLSRRDVVEFLADVMQCDISLGLLSKIETQVSAALEPAYQEAVVATVNAPVRYLDETGWTHGENRGWLWVARTPDISRFLIDDRRSREVAERLGSKHGVSVSDRWVAYSNLEHRQLCWAHLDRTAQGLVERGGVSAIVGQRVLDFIREMFSIWHRFLEGQISRITARGVVIAFGNAMLEDIQAIPGQPGVAQTFVKGLVKVRQYLFTFVRVEGVEPTNNLAERALRPAVMWRRKSQATRSERGRRFVERMLTIVGSCTAQGRSVFEFLRDTLDPTRESPSLLSASA